ncbi:MAG: hypothetical protein ABI321_13585 [Polyangia bacterium]
MLTTTLLLDPRTNREEACAAVARALELVNTARGLTFADDGHETQDDIGYSVWSDDADGATETSWVRLVDDVSGRARYLELHAVDDAILESVRDAIAAQLHVLSHAEIDAAVRDDLSLVAWLGHGGHSRVYDVGTASLIERALASSDSRVVADAQVAIFLLRWRLLLPLVEAALARATSPAQRAALEAIVTASAEWT